MPRNERRGQPPDGRAKQAPRGDRCDELAVFMAASSVGHWIADGDGLDWVYRNPAFEQAAGPSATDLRSWLLSVAGGDDAKAERIVSALRRGETMHVDYRLNALDAPRDWRREFMFPVMDEDRRVRLIGGHSAGIDGSAELEEYERSLLQELKHRVRNILANVRSIARRTGEASGNVTDYMMHLDGRIAALARVQTVMVRDIHARPDLGSLLADTLAGAAAHEGEQISIRGPRITLGDRQASVLALAIHELTTNALKFGALASPSGRLDVGWTVDDDGGRTVLKLRWNESFPAPDHRLPGHRGFGLDYLENSLAFELDAKVETIFDEAGFRCLIELPLATV